MKKVTFYENDFIKDKANQLFLQQRKLIKDHLPQADIQHVGSTAIPNSFTKGDLDIQVRVAKEQFIEATRVLARLYAPNHGSVKTSEFRAFESESTNPTLGLQLTVINSEFDFFWKFRDVLLMNDEYRRDYDRIKMNYEGKDMDSYRQAKQAFFARMMQTPEFQNLDG